MHERTPDTSGRQLSDHLCECGCGYFTTLAARTSNTKGIVRGQPYRYIASHYRPPGRARTPLADRFWSRVLKADADCCWLWMAGKNTRGYGTMGEGGRHCRSVLSHRVSWELANGPIPAGLFVLHHCDNPACVNPGHLFLGTHTDNMRDSASKGRQRYQRHPETTQGSNHPGHKLTEADVVDIRARYRAGGILQRELAAEYGVNPCAIGYIVNRKTWKHLPDPEGEAR